MAEFVVPTNKDVPFSITSEGQQYPVILRVVAGSHLYGLDFKKGEYPFDPEYESDWDFRGVYLAPPTAKLGLEKYPERIQPTAAPVQVTTREAQQIKDGVTPPPEDGPKAARPPPEEDDIVFYELKKFATMALENNPGVLDILFASDESIVNITPQGRRLLESRGLFLSTRIKDAFLGYAKMQMDRLQGHKKWVKEFPKLAEVAAILERAYQGGDIDFQWIAEHFSGALARHITHQDESNKTILGDAKHPYPPAAPAPEFQTPPPDAIIGCPEASPLLMAVQCVPLKYGFSGTVAEWMRYATPAQVRDPANPFHSERTVTREDVAFLATQAAFCPLSRGEYLVYEGGKGMLTRSGAFFAHPAIVAPGALGPLRWVLTVDEIRHTNDGRHLKHAWDWFINRSARRSTLERRFGYDTKYASHVARLLFACRDIVRTGTYCPRLSEEVRRRVLAIRLGEVTFDQFAEAMEGLRADITAAAKTSPLPREPDYAAVNRLLLELSV
ncbi:hypothetical protein PAPYR_1529 [Paratrimastix pyriformis]|uniref:Uncharacterized protein n=1 Tax=Paratrimastix pyriformis TaxID=342808 RepID=A0ABQ8UYL8_9EUKA|nr:hypothetical protein PAPYR_1529 [Paratrimastix pyriformis]